MPVSPTYPGVYIEELPSGVRTIQGVATSITAFVGWAAKGPVNDYQRIDGFQDFERIYGGFHSKCTMSYAVQQYFLNGGATALIVRADGVAGADAVPAAGTTPAVPAVPATSASAALFRLPIGDQAATVTPATAGTPGTPAVAADPTANPPVAAVDAVPAVPASPAGLTAPTTGGLEFQAASPGAWGNQLRLSVDYETKDKADTKQFNLTVVQLQAHSKSVVSREFHRNVSVDPESPRFIIEVLESDSQLITCTNTNDAAARPNSNPIDATEGLVYWKPVTEGTDTGTLTGENLKTAWQALERADIFNLLVLPPLDRNTPVPSATYGEAIKFCVDQRAVCIVDSKKPKYNNVKDFLAETSGGTESYVDSLRADGQNASMYYPYIQFADPLKQGRVREFPPSGAMAGVIARTDVSRGIWKSPAGLEAGIAGAQGLATKLTDPESGQLNPLGVNCLRSFPGVGIVSWGARTLRGADNLADQWKYLAVRRLALFIEESLYRGTQWAVFEPNDEPLWASLRLNVGAFMHQLFRKQAFQGSSPKQAYFVQCDGQTTTQNDINLGMVNVIVGFAPLKPAEFVIIKLQQIAGNIDT